MGRKFVGIELKESYYRQAVSNLLEASQGQALFTWAQEQAQDLADRTWEQQAPSSRWLVVDPDTKEGSL